MFFTSFLNLSQAKMSRKDTTKPKRGLSAYMFFCSDKRADVNKEFPDLTFGDVGKKLGEMWKSLSSEMRAPYEEKAKADKQRYLQEMTQLKGSVEKAKPKTGKIIKKKKDGK